MNFEIVKAKLGLWKAVFWCYQDLSAEELNKLSFKEWENIFLLSETTDLIELSLQKMIEIAKNNNPKRYLDIYITTCLKKRSSEKNVKATLCSN